MRQLLSIYLCLLPSLLFAQEVGDKVIVIADSKTELKSDGMTVGTVKRGNLLRVDKVDAERYWVSHHGTEGWINRNEVIPYDQGIDYFTKSLQRKPSSKDYLLRGAMWANKGNNDKASKDFNEAIRFNPQDADAYCYRGRLWLMKGDCDQAIKDYSEAIRLSPQDADAYMMRGIVWQFKGDTDQAIKDVNEAIRLNPQDTLAYTFRGGVRYMKGDYDQAIKDCNEAIRLNPQDAGAYCTRGSVWIMKGDFDQAIKDYSDAIRLKPNKVAYNSRGAVWVIKGNFDKAIKDFSEVIRLDPKNVSAHSHLAWMYATALTKEYRNGDKAVENATKACELTDWKDDSSLVTLAAAYAEKGDYQQAIKWLRKAMELGPDNNVDVRKEMLELFEAGKPYREIPKA